MSCFGKPLIVTAIDFGTTFSGYAFSTYNNFERDPLNVSTFTWPGAAGQSLKNSTSVLFNPDGKLEAFGYEAEEKFAELAVNKSHQEWHFFRRFKMELYEKQKLNRHFDLMDVNGNKMSAMVVVASVIRYLKNHAMRKCFETVSGLVESDILWVLTVPAIWSDAAKQFMREAAKKAGIQKERLMIVLESEVASLYCKHLTLEKNRDGNLQNFQAGSRYLVLDAGGGTVDISVQEVQKNGFLKAIRFANGGDWGGTKVDDAFFDFLAKIIGRDALESFTSENALENLELCQTLETKKRKITNSVLISIPEPMKRCCQVHNGGKTIEDMVKSSSDMNGHVSVVANKLKVDETLAKSWFAKPLKQITDHLLEIISDPNMHGIKAIMMVGGFSESELLKETIESNEEVKQKHIDIIRPDAAALAVLKGAVICGHKPDSIIARVCRYTYGVETTVLFQEGVHDPSKRYKTGDGEVRCKGIFDTHVCIGQTVNIGEPQKILTYNVSEADSTGMDFPVFRSTERDPMYVKDPGCEKIGKLSVDMPNISKGLDRSVNLHMTFGNTELEVDAFDPSTGESFTAKIDCLE